MNHKDFQLIKNIFRTKDALGFFCYNTFEIHRPDLFKLDENALLDTIIKSPIYSGEFIQPKEGILKLGINDFNRKEHGSLLISEIGHSDFLKLDLNGFKEAISLYQMDEDWGEDLPVFKELFNESISILKQDIEETESIFYLNSEKVDKCKKTEFDYFIYHISVVIPLRTANQVVLIDYGLD